MSLENTFYIHSKYLKLVEPLMQQYYDYDSSMLLDKIQFAVENSGINYMTFENGIVKVDYLKTFYENESLAYRPAYYPYTDIADIHPQYFDFEGEDEEKIKKDYSVYISLEYMSFIYYKQKKGSFNNSSLIYNLDLEYNSILHNRIYPEMLDLYRIILESKKYKNRGEKITLTYKQDKIDINTCAWFLDDMEKYFKDRFPDLTLDTIHELLQTTNKAGRKAKDPYITIMIWGTYQLLKNHHSYFKSEKAKISIEICQFIINYLNHIGAEHDFVDTDIKDNLKDMLKRNYVPKWNLPWRNVFSSIKEKEPENEFERLNQPSRKYNLSNL